MIRVTICGAVVPVEQIEAICAAVGASVDVLRVDRPGRPSVATIIADVAHEMGLSTIDIVSARQNRAAARARFAVSFVARHVTPYSLPMIARALGGRDHGTIISQLRRAEQQRDGRDPAFARLTDKLIERYREARA